MEFKNIALKKPANVYFDGKVTSRTANSSFDVVVKVYADYCCSYINVTSNRYSQD
ncbi:hypothetical protein [Romboutsia sp.]|uniref:hypothetical protein n=1 Tax=Romboutsia sp. TaxID=1965302 RepID=UPI003F392C3A